ncbi:MAG TPA: TonB-dependent receptor [Bacteroidia bacterium]|nr:TonB-dependent receptor [Bacteroidia bacterium]
MFRIHIFCIVFVLHLNPAKSQITISGTVYDTGTHEKLAGVSVYLPDLKKGCLSDKDGNYRISGLKKGAYLMEAAFIGYRAELVKLDAEHDTTIDLYLSVSAHELSEIVITGVSRSTEIKRSPVVITSIDSKQLNQNSSTNLIDALKTIPGVDQISTGPSISKPLVRGMGYNRVITLNNGIRQEGQQWGDEHGIEIDEYTVDRVEIIKGPGSLMYGSDGIAGVLNFIGPKTPAEGEHHVQYLSNFQSNAKLFANSLFGAGRSGAFQYSARLTQKNAGNYSNAYDGKVYNSGFGELDATTTMGINSSWGHSLLTLSSYNASINLVEGQRDSLGYFTYTNSSGQLLTATAQDLKGFKTGVPHQDITHRRAVLNNYLILGRGALALDLAYQNNLRKESGDPLHPDAASLYFDLGTLNYNLRYNLPRLNGWECSAGFGGMQQTNFNKGLEFIIPQYSLLDMGAFVYTQRSFHKLSMAAGLRFDQRMLDASALYLDQQGKISHAGDSGARLKFNALLKRFSGFSGSAGLSYQVNANSTLKLNFARGYRAPTVAELCSNGKHEGSFRYELGNSDLKTEISQQLDLAYSLNSEHISLELSPFINSITHFIYTEKLSALSGGDSIPDPGDPTPAFKFTQNKALLLGGEVYLDIHPHPFDWLHIANSFAFVQASQANANDSTRFLPFIPAPRYRMEIKTELVKNRLVFSKTFFRLALDYYFPKNNVFSAYGTETPTPDYALLSLGFGTSIRTGSHPDRLKLFLNVENLTNHAYQNHLSRLKYAPVNPYTGRTGVYNMGRNVSIKIILAF